MFPVRFLRYARGWVRFEAHGGFPERMLNLAARQSIAVWGAYRLEDGGLSACTSATAYPRLREPAKRAGVHLKLVKKGGFPFVRNHYSKRTGLLAGVVAFIVLLLATQAFVWRVEVNGNTRVDTAAITQNLAELGVRPGVLRRKLDARDIERQMLLRLPDLGWIAVNLQGGVAEIRIHERTLPPPNLDSGAPCNIIASQAGQITYLEVYEGQTMVKVGDTVAAGDIIVSGMAGKEDGRQRLVHANARVLAEVPASLQVHILFKQVRYKAVGALRRWGLYAFGVEFPLYIATPVPRPYKLEKLPYFADILGLRLPLALVKNQYLLAEEITTTLTPEQAMELAESMLTAMERAKFSSNEITYRSAQAQQKEDGVTMVGDYRIIIDIAKEKEILIE